MTELQLYKFIHNNNIEHRWEDNDDVRDILVFIPPYLLQEFFDLNNATFFDDGGYPVQMTNGYIVVWFLAICEHYDIDFTEVFGEDEQ